MHYFKKHKILIGCAVILALVLIIVLKNFTSQLGLSVLPEPLRKGSIIESVYGIGTVTATKSYQLKMGVTSNISKLYVAEGDQVKKGDPLVDIEGTTLFRAPFAGTITYLPTKVGEAVFAQSVILSLVDLLDRYIIVSLEQRGALRVRYGQKAKINFDSMRAETFEGTVQSVYSNENNFLVRIGVSDLPPQILPGMTADVAIGIIEHQNVLLVPVSAIDKGKVFVKRGIGRPVAIEIKTGIVDGAEAEVISGDLQEGDYLYTRTKVTP